MVIYPEQKFAFQHVNRCGGITVREVIKSIAGDPDPLTPPPGNSHQAMKARYNRVKKKGIDIDNYSIYANVRNPFHRIVNIYEYRKSRRRYKKVSFKEFFYNEYVEEKTVPSGPIDNLILIDGKALPNLKIIKLEEINSKWPEIILSHFGTKPTMPKLNSVEHSDPISYYDNQMISIVKEKDYFTINNFYPEIVSK